MNTHVLLSFDLKQNVTTENRKLFDKHLEGRGWKDCPDVSSTKTKAFEGEDVENVKLIAVMEIYEAALHAKIVETSFVIQCGNSAPFSKTFYRPQSRLTVSQRLGLLKPEL